MSLLLWFFFALLVILIVLDLIRDFKRHNPGWGNKSAVDSWNAQFGVPPRRY